MINVGLAQAHPNEQLEGATLPSERAKSNETTEEYTGLCWEELFVGRELLIIVERMKDDT